MKTIRLTESNLLKVINKIIKEQFHVKSDEFENYYANSGISIEKIGNNQYLLGPIKGHEMNVKFTDDGYYLVKPSYYGGYYEDSPRSFEDTNSVIDYINNFDYESNPDPKGAGAYHRRLHEQKKVMKKKIIITESDLCNTIKKVLKEDRESIEVSIDDLYEKLENLEHDASMLESDIEYTGYDAMRILNDASGDLTDDESLGLEEVISYIDKAQDKADEAQDDLYWAKDKIETLADWEVDAYKPTDYEIRKKKGLNEQDERDDYEDGWRQGNIDYDDPRQLWDEWWEDNNKDSAYYSDQIIDFIELFYDLTPLDDNPVTWDEMDVDKEEYRKEGEKLYWSDKKSEDERRYDDREVRPTDDESRYDDRNYQYGNSPDDDLNEHEDLPTVRRSEKDMLRRRPYSPKARFKAGL